MKRNVLLFSEWLSVYTSKKSENRSTFVNFFESVMNKIFKKILFVIR